MVARSPFLNADDEYTPEQRRFIDAQLDEAEGSPTHGPFQNADEAISFLRKEIKVRTSQGGMRRVHNSCPSWRMLR